MTGASTSPGDGRPNVIVILADDLGFSDLGCFGGEIATPNLDRLGRAGVRHSAFYNTARCSPSRASLLTGRDPHETGIGILTEDDRAVGGYPGTISDRWPTMAEHLKAAGYQTCLSGKWHLSSDTTTPNDSWPTRRGFDEFYGILMGADHYFHPIGLYHNEEKLPSPAGDGYYLTDAVSEHARRWISQRSDRSPYFLYLAYTAPHWPLHAPEADIARYSGVYEQGWDVLRARRRQRLLDEQLLNESAALSERDPNQPAWSVAPDQEWEARRMAVYAAMVTAMDRGIGAVLDAVEARGELDRTMVIFLSDNGGCAEVLPPGGRPLFRTRQRTETVDGAPMRIGSTPDIWPGGPDTYTSYGQAWANLSNSPFRLYKRWVHEGGIATPFIASWPDGGLANGTVVDQPFQLTDILPTVLAAAQSPPADGRGISMLDAWRGRAGPADHVLYWEHIGNCAIRDHGWKLVREAGQDWELYRIDTDRTELNDLVAEHPRRAGELTGRWLRWAESVGVLPWPPAPTAPHQPPPPAAAGSEPR